MKIATRFAPSPSGFLHLGGIRTALYSWLFARKHKGVFILRIEDTNCNKYKKKSIKNIIESMKWLNLDWDEGPYFQSDRINRYEKIMNEMLSLGVAYKCFCSKERLEYLKNNNIKYKKKPKYDKFCRKNDFKHSQNEKYVVRFCNPEHGIVSFNDMIHGTISVNNNELDDLIIRRVDGTFTYNFAVIVDDLDMKITHVIRGNDHINNTPRQINILKSINAKIPNYAHVPILLGGDGKKLSKRLNSISIMKFKEEGFLPESLLNYLVRIGWSKGDQEIFSIDEMKKYFDIKNISKSAGIFNKKKLLWLNHHYINNLDIKYIANNLKWYLNKQKINFNNKPQLEHVVELLKKSCFSLKEMANKCYYFYDNKINLERHNNNIYLSKNSLISLKLLKNQLKDLNNWDIEQIQNTILQISKKLTLKLNLVCMPLRLSITGEDKSPAINSIVYLIGKERCLLRISNAINFIQKNIIDTNI